MAEKKLRCAIYTRKSTEDGLEQEFNSLDAQYEACAAYALSQQHEGWVVSKDRYDDGGFSGGNMDRPGLRRLLADIEEGRIDIVLLYKIDRLTRSLTDFAKIVEVMDGAGASFVSITQSFNTTTSMGRLTLNMLLSFAQFEREVTGERIRDKIAASKKKGMWMGGPVPLGYDVKDRKLVVNEAEAEQVRHIMRRYLALSTVPKLAEELNREGYRTKVQVRASGPHRGGCSFQRGTLYHLLSNRIYRGMIVHKGKAYPGEHQPIVDEDLWDDVQALLEFNANGSSRRKHHQHPSLLIGKVTDGEGRKMTPSHSNKGRRRYRYYVTRPEEVDGSSAWRVSAVDLEELVCKGLSDRLGDKNWLLGLFGDEHVVAEQITVAIAKADLLAAQLRSSGPRIKADILEQIVAQVELQEGSIAIRLEAKGLGTAIGIAIADEANEYLEIHMLAVRVRRGHQIRLIIPGSDSAAKSPPKRDETLVCLVAEALAARKLVEANPGSPISNIARLEGKCRTRLGNLVKLSCMAPDIVQAIIEGKQPATLSARSLSNCELPLSWKDQRIALGFA